MDVEQNKYLLRRFGEKLFRYLSITQPRARDIKLLQFDVEFLFSFFLRSLIDTNES